ncbi:MAG: IS30 family transposase [Gammaproteobacteria bacterium]|nr:IS30 family transposase [Gammaproteobacteria bacterium]MBK85471.1 IS30 family transposase [Gammaproteobacteria bacterium]|tara:strand:- start:142 stop:1110 length:969 start_codon:yes stop_codon:yes gene_type:complete
MGYKQLTEIERYQIKTLLALGHTPTSIANELKRSPSTISREIQRNTGLRGYRPKQAQKLAEERKALKPKKRILNETWVLVEKFIKEDWSPEQISNRLTAEGHPSVSHEWIYCYILADKSRGGDLYKHLRCQKKRKKRYGSPHTRGQIKNRTGIEERPAIVDEKSRKGDWEIDTVIGQQGGQVLVTAAERKTRFSLIAIAKDKSAESVSEALIRVMQAQNNLPVKTMTYDNGKEFAAHERISEALNAKAFFARPYHSWERGLNENMNGLIRQYAPKGSNFDKLTDEDAIYIMDQLNNRPRKCLNYKTPNEVVFGKSFKFALTS